MGLDVNERLNENGMTPLLAACCEGNLFKVEQLLLSGASITTQSTDGMTVWSWAKRHMIKNTQGQRQYPLQEILLTYWKKEKQFYYEMIAEWLLANSTGKSAAYKIPFTI